MCVWRAPAMTLHFLCLQCGLIGNGLPISPLKPLHLLCARESAGIPVCRRFGLLDDILYARLPRT